MERVVDLTCSFFSLAGLADAFSQMEQQNVAVGTVLVSPIMYANFRTLNRDVMFINELISKIQEGEMGMIWGATIKLDRGLRDDVVVLKPLNENIDLTVKLFVNPSSSEIKRIHEELVSIQSELRALSQRVAEVLCVLGRAGKLHDTQREGGEV